MLRYRCWNLNILLLKFENNLGFVWIDERICEEGREWICEDIWGCLDWKMIEWICNDDLLKFVSDMIVGRKIINYFKDVKCKFTNLSLLLKNIWIMNYEYFCVNLN